LPDWAERIFTESMISAGNVSDPAELAQISSIAKNNLAYYLNTVSDTNGHSVDVSRNQNYYCDNQQKNPHTPKVMTALGLNEEDVRVFIQECLFPKIGTKHE
jgi:hypothetical protein